jgi:hypothetical protein
LNGRRRLRQHRERPPRASQADGAGIYHAINGVFWALVVVAVLGVAAQLLLPRKVTPID